MGKVLEFKRVRNAPEWATPQQMLLAEKIRKQFEPMIETGMVQVVINTSTQGLNLPEHLFEKDEVRLNLSLRFGPEAMDWNDWEVDCTLSFNKTPRVVKIPWIAMEKLLHFPW